MKLIRILSILILAHSILACTVTNTQQIVIGNSAAICFTVTLDKPNATQTLYYVFKTQIDRFTSFKFNGLASRISNFSATNVTVLAQFQNKAGNGSQNLIVNTVLNLKRSFFSIVINTFQGGFVSIAPDNFCAGCAQCYSDTCFDNFASKYDTTDLVVYVSWAGSDQKKDDYLSSAKRLSRFSLYSVTAMYDNVKNMIQNVNI